LSLIESRRPVFCGMYYEQVIYHVYNQSINYELLFRERSNYLFFLEKLRSHILPLADVISYCLMPDHFHLMLKPTALGCGPSRCGRFLRLDEGKLEEKFQQRLSHGIKIVLSSYTRTINRQYHRRGSLFRAKTKAKPGYSRFYPDSTGLDDLECYTRFIPYLQTCFHYIHDNPVKAQLVTDPMEWEFSSALDYGGWRDSKLCNFSIAENLLGIKRSTDKTGPVILPYAA
ncbi:MAG: hypothetical protein WA952_18075, partial [Lewinella sp.]